MDEEAVREFVDQAQTTVESSPQMDEEATKFRLVVPFIELLGWDTRSTGVEPEHTVRMATRKTKVDFALLLGDTPVVFIEAKPARSTLDKESVEQLRSYMRQELDVDWGVVTNGKSFEILTKGNNGRQEEISLIQFDLNDLKKRPDLLEILTKESIQSGKSNEIATQIAQAGEAIRYLQGNKEQVAKDLNDILLDNIGRSVPLDTEAQTTEFIDELISALDEQRKTIDTITSPTEAKKSTAPEVEDIKDVTGEYIIKIQDDGTTLATFGDDKQADTMIDVVNYLIEYQGLISEIEPLPYVPGRTKAIINDTQEWEQADHSYKELVDGFYLDTKLSKEGKRREISGLVEHCSLDVAFEGEW